MSEPRVFVSHSHQDDIFTNRLVADLRYYGARVWVDVTGMDPGNFMERISQALDDSDWLLVVLTPAALASPYVKLEVDAALHRVQQGFMRGVIPVVAEQCAPRSIPALWDILHRFDASSDYNTALMSLLRALGMVVRMVASVSNPSDDLLPPRLADLGFRGISVGGLKAIVPPLCSVPAGAFLMGSNPLQDRQTRADEQPQHQVDVAAF